MQTQYDRACSFITDKVTQQTPARQRDGAVTVSTHPPDGAQDSQVESFRAGLTDDIWFASEAPKGKGRDEFKAGVFLISFRPDDA